MSFPCSYEGCMQRRVPCSSITFFRLPNDDRRPIWIRNSGNRNLKHLKPQQSRFFCEKHFNSWDISIQFNRKMLRYWAVPVPHQSVLTSLSADELHREHLQLMTNKRPSNSVVNVHLDEDNNILETCTDDNLLMANEQTDISKDMDMILTDDFLEDNYDSLIEEDDGIDNFWAQLKVLPDSADIQPQQHVESSVRDVIEAKTAESSSSFDQTKIDKGTRTQNTSKPSTSSSASSAATPSEDLSTDYVSDKHFALSLVHHFQGIEPQKKAIAKIKILQFLTMLKYSNEMPDLKI